MELHDAKINSECPSVEISSYIDGELSPQQELDLELHLANCGICVEELNVQKKLLCAINASLKGEDELELPADFTKVVVANAESRVSGLRRPRERFNAAFICSALGLFVLFGLGAEAANVFGGFVRFFDQAAAVASFGAHVVYDFSIGTIVILRSLSSQFLFNSAFLFLLPGLLAFVLFAFSRVVLRIDRT